MPKPPIPLYVAHAGPSEKSNKVLYFVVFVLVVALAFFIYKKYKNAPKAN
jgi:hypothetical protein